jgi:hypothetical protein
MNKHYYILENIKMGNTASGVGAYKINLIPENKMGGG